MYYILHYKQLLSQDVCIFSFSGHSRPEIRFKTTISTAFLKYQPLPKNGKTARLHSFWIATPVNLIHLRIKMNYKIYQKIASLDLRIALKRLHVALRTNQLKIVDFYKKKTHKHWFIYINFVRGKYLCFGNIEFTVKFP